MHFDFMMTEKIERQNEYIVVFLRKKNIEVPPCGQIFLKYANVLSEEKPFNYF